MTTILEDLAELCLSSNRKLVKDDNDLLVLESKLEVDDNHKQSWGNGMVRQLTAAFNDENLPQSLLKQGKFQESGV